MKTVKFVGICILVFIVAIIIGVITKFAIKPWWSKKYSVEWSDEIGTLYEDISYGKEESNKFDLYVPKDNSKAISRAIEYIENNLTNDITIQDIAEHVYISPFYFQKRAEQS